MVVERGVVMLETIAALEASRYRGEPVLSPEYSGCSSRRVISQEAWHVIYIFRPVCRTGGEPPARSKEGNFSVGNLPHAGQNQCTNNIPRSELRQRIEGNNLKGNQGGGELSSMSTNGLAGRVSKVGSGLG